MNLTPVSSSLNNQYVIQSGDKLVWRQNQSQAYGGVYVFTTDGSNGAWTLTDQNGEYCNDSMQTDGNWHLRTVDLSPFAGKMVGSVQLVAEGNSPPGNWTLEFADIALVGADGTALPIYNGGTTVSGSPWGTGGYTQPAIAVQSIPSATGDTTYYIGDQLASTRMTISSSGWPLSAYVYYPFGQEQNPTVDPNHYKFTGKERDTESGLDYFGARYYSSTMGRFMTPDPAWFVAASVADPQSWNLYAYARNNPLSNIDPDGYDCVYLNDSGTDVDRDANGNVTGIDRSSNSNECGQHHGYWVDDTFDHGTVYANNNDVSLTGHTTSTDIQGNMTNTPTDAFYTNATGHLSDIVQQIAPGATGTIDLIKAIKNMPKYQLRAQNPVDVWAFCAVDGVPKLALDLSPIGIVPDALDAMQSGSLNPLFNSGDKANDAGNASDVVKRGAEALSKTLPLAGPVAKRLGTVGAGISIYKYVRDTYHCGR